jgi:cell division control protein 6
MLGILSSNENRSGSPGNYYSYELDVPSSSTVDAMADVSTLNSEVKMIREIDSMSNVA